MKNILLFASSESNDDISSICEGLKKLDKLLNNCTGAVCIQSESPLIDLVGIIGIMVVNTIKNTHDIDNLNNVIKILKNSIKEIESETNILSQLKKDIKHAH